MSQPERHASGTEGGGGAATATRPAATPPSLVRAATATARVPAQAVLWESLFQSASLSQQHEILSLASRQGLVYAYQLPVPVNGSRQAAPLEEEARGRPFLTKLLGGHVNDLEAVRISPVAVQDAALDGTQREAVARALSTPDMCLIQGLPGTGKSRVVAELVTQAAAQGLRVLLLAPGPAAIDQVLLLAGSRDPVCPLRCLGRDEQAENLPPAVRALTFSERMRVLAEDSLGQVRCVLETEETRWRRCQQDGAVWDRLERLAGQRERLFEQREALARERAGCNPEVESEAAGKSDTATPQKEDTATLGSEGKPGQPAGLSLRQAFAAALAASARTYQETLTHLDAALADLHRLVAEHRRELAARQPELEALRPLALAKDKGRWWTWTWWRATFRGNVRSRLATLEDQHKATRVELARLEDQIRQSDQERATVESVFRSERAALIESEIARRQSALDEQDDALGRELDVLEGQWQASYRDLDGDTLRPALATAQAVREARDQWRGRLQQAEERLAFTRAWAAYLQQAAATLGQRLPAYVNLVASTTTGLAGDEHFGDQAALGTEFDLLILEEAERVTEAEFLRVARRARRWVLVGSCEDMDADNHGPAETEKPGMAPSARRRVPVSFFGRLWQHLHCDPRRLPYTWARENDRLCCRLRPLAAEQRPWLESEHVVDFPEIELRILVYPRVQPLLAEVLFPPSMSIAQAKEYIFRELQELPVQATGHSLRWADEPGRLVLCTGDGNGATAVNLEPGVRELVGGGDGEAAVPWHTCRLEFDQAMGWQRARAEEWVGRHLGVRDLGRTVRLDVARRMRPCLAAFLSDVLFDGAYRLPAAAPLAAQGAAPDSPPAVEFVPVPSPIHDNGSRRRGEGDHRIRGNGSRVHAPPPPRPARGGAGLELDLAAARYGDRLPSELRAGLPDRGFVNYLEAQAVVRTLEALAKGPGRCADVLVLALYPAQAELIHRLVNRSPLVAVWGDRLAVDVAGAARHREASVVLISLTRSHSHRAVSYGEDPRALVLALTRARHRLILFGDLGTLARRVQWEGPLDHLDDDAAGRERKLIAHLHRYLQGQGRHPQVFQLREGSGS